MALEKLKQYNGKMDYDGLRRNAYKNHKKKSCIFLCVKIKGTSCV